MHILFERHDTVIAESIFCSPYGDIRMHQGNAYGFVGALVATKQKHRRYAKGYGDNWRIKILFILVLMQRKTTTWSIPINETGIWFKRNKSSGCGCLLSQIEECCRHCGPFPISQWVTFAISIATPICCPAQVTTVGHRDRHIESAWRYHVAE